MQFPVNLGDVYYSVGPLQHGCIEEWEYTNDRYDRSRLVANNVYPTKEQAEAFLLYMQAYEG